MKRNFLKKRIESIPQTSQLNGLREIPNNKHGNHVQKHKIGGRLKSQNRGQCRSDLREYCKDHEAKRKEEPKDRIQYLQLRLTDFPYHKNQHEYRTGNEQNPKRDSHRY